METNTTIGSFIRNLETGKLELHFSKRAYDALTDAQRAEIRRHFLWARSLDCWISRAKLGRTYFAEQAAKKLGLADEGSTGEKLPFAEQMARISERAEARADRYDARVERSAANAEALQREWDSFRGDIAFMTQPNISSSGGRRFTRYRDRVRARYERGFEELSKAEHYERRAAAARSTASQGQLSNPAFLDRRIEENLAELRRAEREVAAYLERNPHLADGGESAYLDRLEELLDDTLDRLAFYRERMAEAGGVRYSRADVKPGDSVQIRGRWGLVEKASPKTVTVRSFTLSIKYPYAEIQAHRRAGEQPATEEQE